MYIAFRLRQLYIWNRFLKMPASPISSGYTPFSLLVQEKYNEAGVRRPDNGQEGRELKNKCTGS